MSCFPPFQVKMFAPNVDQMHVVNHCEGKPTEEKRNVLQESARIARGDVADLAKLDAAAFDAAIIPGQTLRYTSSLFPWMSLFFPAHFMCVVLQGALARLKT